MPNTEIESQLPKTTFDGISQRREKLVFETLRTGVRMYLTGAHNNYGDKAPLAKNLKEESEAAVRIGGQLLANIFELSAENVGSITDEILKTDEQFDQRPGTFSFVTARLAEGLYEEGQTELAEEVVERYLDGDFKLEVEKYFELSAGNLVRSYHV